MFHSIVFLSAFLLNAVIDANKFWRPVVISGIFEAAGAVGAVGAVGIVGGCGTGAAGTVSCTIGDVGAVVFGAALAELIDGIADFVDVAVVLEGDGW